MLEQEFGVAPSQIHWYVERSPSLSHGGQNGFKPPKGVTIERVPGGQTLLSLLASGELDASCRAPIRACRRC